MTEAATAPPERSPHSTKAVLLRVLAAVAVAAVAFLLDRVVFADNPGHERFGSKVRTLTTDSVYLDRSLPMKVVVPPRAPSRDRSLVVFLHGRGEDERSYLVDPMFEALSKLKGRAPVMAFPFGGESSYWHDRDSGDWATYVSREVIPRLVDRFDIDPDRIAIGGISMGGYGAYNIARLNPGMFCAIGGHSPALWESSGETADGAFDDSTDFDDNDVITIAGEDPSPYEGAKLWIDAGNSDPFLPGDDALEAALRSSGLRPVVKHSPGGHDSSYWNGNWDEYLGFYAHALNHCTIGSKPKAPKTDSENGPPTGHPQRKPANGKKPPRTSSDQRGEHSGASPRP